MRAPFSWLDQNSPLCDRTKIPGAAGNATHSFLGGSLCLSRLGVSNLSLTPAGIWHFYDGRAALERRIRELREDYALRKVPTRAFAANALYLEVIRLAYNLVTAFQRTCVPEEWQALTLSKLRHRLFWLPGELSRPENRPTLWLGTSPSVRLWTEKILHRASKLKPLEN
jgi:hypothetical protein